MVLSLLCHWYASLCFHRDTQVTILLSWRAQWVHVCVHPLCFCRCGWLGLPSIVLWWCPASTGALYLVAWCLLLLLCTDSLAGTSRLLLSLCLYLLAKVCESLDKEIYALLHFSGHSIKHLLAAYSTYQVYAAVCHRKKITKTRVA